MASFARVAWQGYPQPRRMMVIFGLFWLGILAIPLEPPGIVGLYSVCYVLVVSGTTGNALRERLVSSRARTVPDYLRAHLTVALGLCAVTAIVSAGIGAFRGLPMVSSLSFLWSCALLALAAGYVVPAGAVDKTLSGIVFISIVALALVLSKVDLNGLMAGKMSAATTLILLVVNTAATIFFVHRMRRLGEGAFEYLDYDPERLARSQAEQASRRPNPTLDSMPKTLPSDLRLQLKHLAMGLGPTSEFSLVRLAGTLTIAFLILKFFLGKPAGTTFQTSLYASVAVMGPLFVANNHLVRFFTLPLPRRELVAKGGSVLLLASLRIWCVFAVAVALSDWSMSTVESLLTSSLLQLPIFGIVTLGMSIRGALTTRNLVFIIPAILVIAILAIASHDFPLQVRNAFYAISGAASIGLSYYRWCNAELA